jgi:hypothetical protein
MRDVTLSLTFITLTADAARILVRLTPLVNFFRL